MNKIVVVGSGVSGTHAALTLLERGHEVELWDVGREEQAFPEHGATFHELKDRLADPVTYFLGADLGTLVPPASPELLRYPASREFLTSPEDALWNFISDSFFPRGSFAKGGLANGWGANALSFDDNDLAEWPVSFSEMEAAYKTVYDRIPVAGPIDDDLTPHLRGVYPSQPPFDCLQRSATAEHLPSKEAEAGQAGREDQLCALAVVTDPSRQMLAIIPIAASGDVEGIDLQSAPEHADAVRGSPGFRYIRDVWCSHFGRATTESTAFATSTPRLGRSVKIRALLCSSLPARCKQERSSCAPSKWRVSRPPRRAKD